MRMPTVIVVVILSLATATLFAFRDSLVRAPRQVSRGDGSPYPESMQNAFGRCGGVAFPASASVLECLKAEYHTRCAGGAGDARTCGHLAALNNELSYASTGAAHPGR